MTRTIEKKHMVLPTPTFDLTQFPFVSKHDAFMEIRRRRKNGALKELLDAHGDGTKPLPMKNGPYAVFFRQIGTASHETLRFLRAIKGTRFTPLILEYHGDKFVSAGNSYKRSLGKMPIYQYTGADGRDMVKYSTVIDFNAWTGKLLSDIRCRDGSGFIEFHHRLLARIAKVNPKKLCHDATPWFASHGDRADKYYTALLSCFIRDAVLFEHFEPSVTEATFVETIMMPAFRAIEIQYGYQPLIVELVSPTEKNWSFWDYYPKKTERYL